MKIRPVLAEKCFRCHGDNKQESSLRLDSRAGALKGGDSGAAVVPGKPEDSLLIEAIKYESFEMPPSGKLPDEQIAAMEVWVRMGAPWPAGAAVDPTTKITQEDRAHWAFQPVAAAPRLTVSSYGGSNRKISRRPPRRILLRSYVACTSI
jgi:mono/diheme cytochrome c family protein